jgi:hypothetical protein
MWRIVPLTPRRRAAAALVSCIVLLAAAMWTAQGRSASPASAPISAPGAPDVAEGRSDPQTFRNVIQRTRAGERYYAAFGDELRKNGYPAAHVFNWRTPALFSVLRVLPDRVSWSLWLVTAAATCIAGASLLLDLPAGLVIAALMLVGAVSATDPSVGLVVGESWAGMFIGLSAFAYARRRRMTGAVMAVLALFVRELAAPYCVMCTLTSAWRRHWRETGLWTAAALAYAAFYAWHVREVWANQLPADPAHAEPWLQARGLTFVMETVRFNRWLSLAPDALVAVALVAIFAGVAARETPLHVRRGSAVYLVFFLIAGQSFNNYWGMVAWPLWAVASVYGALAVFRWVASVVSIARH